uniref:Carboxylic ester hydrolase n=1 Tax=Meteorus pulchricornis TaxID=51522 RepID=A0A4D6J450_9HYME|nr:carboxylesterase 12 [Meteorus pulchricornis]
MSDPIVRVHQGQLRGVNETNINGQSYVAFRGVPYAKPPIGELRFKDSEPHGPWSGVRDATKFGGRCAQVDWLTRDFTGGDDCLYLNIYTTTLNPPVPKAVMVYIHGGGFVFGSGDDDMYGPDYLIEKDIVLVTLNYRLGIFGFLNADDEEAPGNQGLKDQVLALKWIQQNIARFGGNPDNVTIFGESAGGAAVHYLTISPLAQGLFHKAIMQSGVALNQWAVTIIPPMETIKKLAFILDYNLTDVKAFINYLRTLDPKRLIEADSKIRTRKDKILSIQVFLPSIDSKSKHPFMPISQEEAAKAGIKVPCMCGTVSHEGILIAAAVKKDTFDDVGNDPENVFMHPKTLTFMKRNNVTMDAIKRYYFGDEEISTNNIEKLVDALSTIYFTLGIHNVVEIQTKVPNVPMYFYKFEYDIPDSILKASFNINTKGTCHAEDIGFLFYQKMIELLDKKPPAPGSTEHLIIQRFTEMWTNFAKTGNPTPQITDLIPIEWKPVDSSNEYKCLHITDKLEMITEINVAHRLQKSIKNKL